MTTEEYLCQPFVSSKPHMLLLPLCANSQASVEGSVGGSQILSRGLLLLASSLKEQKKRRHSIVPEDSGPFRRKERRNWHIEFFRGARCWGRSCWLILLLLRFHRTGGRLGGGAHRVKDSVADTDSAKLHKPKQVTHPEQGTHKMLWELRTGRTHCCSGVPGSFHREGGLGSWTTKDHFICTGRWGKEWEQQELRCG